MSEVSLYKRTNFVENNVLKYWACSLLRYITLQLFLWQPPTPSTAQSVIKSLARSVRKKRCCIYRNVPNLTSDVGLILTAETHVAELSSKIRVVQLFL